MERKDPKRIVIEVTDEVHQHVKILAAEQSISLKKFILRCIQREFNRLEHLKGNDDSM